MSLRFSRAGGSDEGSISILVAWVAISAILLVGLIVDGGGRMRANQRADSLAAEAARAGGQAIDVRSAMTGGTIRADPAAAQLAAERYLARAGVSGRASVSADRRTLTVTVTTHYTAAFTAALGAGDVTATARATLVHGVSTPE